MIDTTFKTELMSALQQAVSEYNSSGDPTGAVIKAARVRDFNPEQAKRLTETFNTARTLYQYTNGEKTAEFPLADSSKVVLGLYEVKKADAVVYDMPDYSEYDLPENMAKAATVVLDADAPITSVSREALPSLESQCQRFYKVAHTYDDMATHSESVAAQAEIAGVELLKKIAADIHRQYAEDAADDLARIKVAWADDRELGPVIAALDVHMRDDIVKAASDLYVDVPVIDDRPIRRYYDMLKEAAEYRTEACNMAAMSVEARKIATDIRNEFEGMVLKDAPAKINDPLGEFFSKRADNTALRTTTTTAVRDAPAFPAMFDRPGDLEAALRSATKDTTTSVAEVPLPPSGKGGITAKPVEALLTQQVGELSNALSSSRKRKRRSENSDSTAALKNTQRQVLLEDLMLNDPILSEADPGAIRNAFTAAMELAPDATVNKEIMRSFLRQAVHADALSPYDASAMTELEKLLQETRGTKPPTKTMRVEGDQ